MNGTTSLNTNSYISLGLVPLIIATTAWILLAVGGASGKADKAADASTHTNELITALTLRVEGIDSGGTRGAHQLTESNTQRIGKLEETTGKLVPDVAEIKTNLGWIAEWVKTQKKDTR